MRTFVSLVLATLLALVSCQKFDPPPGVKVDGLENGVMKTAPEAPFVIRFSEPIVESTLRVKLVEAITDEEGNLLDEQDPPDLEAFAENTVAAFDGAAQENEDSTYGGTFELTSTSLSVDLNQAFSVSTAYLLLIEPGLEDQDGNKTLPRQRIPFTFELMGGGPTVLPSGYYYFLMNVEYLATQIQVYTYMDVNPETGVWRAIFTNGNRLEALNSRPGCPSCSGDTPVCALIPSPACVAPSQKQLSLEQYVDFLPEPDPPYGYFFVADGFARDEANGTTAFGTAPFLIEVTVGTGGILVDAENSRVNGIFRKHEDGRWRASGSISVERVKLNGVGKDPTQGNFEAMSLTDDEVKAVESFGYPIPTDLDKQMP